MSIAVTEVQPIEVLRHPYPYQAAFTIASDIDTASVPRFRAVHALFCGHDVIQEGSREWKVLGLTVQCPQFDRIRGGVCGLGFELSDSFFLVGDPTTFGMYRYAPQKRCFMEDRHDGENCATLVRQWIAEGQIDSFHAFLHHTRRQVEPLLKDFYNWCERENIPKPKVWINHSKTATPSGLCPARLQPSPFYRFARFAARNVAGPLLNRKRLPLRYVFAGYQGAKPGDRYYVNDLLAANGLRYVWLNVEDLYRNRICLPEHEQNGRTTLLQSVTMDDGVRYWRFERCYGWQSGGPGGESYLRDSQDGCDASHLITKQNLSELCTSGGTCILYTHWTHHRSMPIADDTLSRFKLLQHWRDDRKIWVTSTARLLEWTRLRTFLKLVCRRESKRLVVEMDGVEDPIFGRERINLRNLHGLSFRLRQTEPSIVVVINGQALGPTQLRREGNLCWLDAGDNSAEMSATGSRSLNVHPDATSSCSDTH